MIARADYLTRRWTGFHSFVDLLNSVDDPVYFPTLIPPRGRSKSAQEEAAEFAELADLYDAAQAARGDARRAYRGRAQKDAGVTG